MKRAKEKLDLYNFSMQINIVNSNMYSDTI